VPKTETWLAWSSSTRGSRNVFMARKRNGMRQHRDAVARTTGAVAQSIGK